MFSSDGGGFSIVPLQVVRGRGAGLLGNDRVRRLPKQSNLEV
jgi:hypothetical protein